MPKKSLQESCITGRRIVVMKLICSLGHCECDDHTVNKLSKRRLTADWLAQRESDCSRMHSKVSSDCLLSYIKATRPVVEIFKMDGYFPDRPRVYKTHTCSLCAEVRNFNVKLCNTISSHLTLKTLFFYFRCRTAGQKSVFGRSCGRPPRHRIYFFFPVSKSKGWDGSQNSKLPLHASHVAPRT